MRNSVGKSKISIVELVFFLIALLLLWVVACLLAQGNPV